MIPFLNYIMQVWLDKTQPKTKIVLSHVNLVFFGHVLKSVSICPSTHWYEPLNVLWKQLLCIDVTDKFQTS